MLEVTYTTAADDLMALNKHMMKRSPSHRRRFVLGRVALPSWVWLIGAGFYMVDLPTRWVIGAAVGGLLFAVGYPAMYFTAMRRQVRAYAKAWGGAFGRTTLTLTDEGVRVRTPATETAARWDTMKEAVEDGDHTYIFFTGLTAVILPRGGFERAEDYAAARDFALAKLSTKS